jgi:SAM-dependent methyltransferase
MLRMSAYTTVTSQRSMNFDRVRNPFYQRAIREAVTPESVVLDLGAGLGMLGFLAARAGARKVYLVEPEPVIEVTRKVAEANGLENVECIRATVEELELPEKADLIISVFTGNFLLTEDLLPSLFNARDRFLAPGGRMLPDCARMIAAPVSVPDYYQERVNNWALVEASAHDIETYGIDYRAARPFCANSIFFESGENLKPRLLADPACLAELDFMTAGNAGCDSQIAVSIKQSELCHGWLGWFDMRLGAKWLSTAPDAEPTHWRQMFMPLDQPVRVEAGQSAVFGLKRPEHGEWTWTTEIDGRSQRQSTFRSAPFTREMMLRKSERFKPELNERGQAILHVLNHMDGTTSTGQLIDALQQKFGGLFHSREATLQFVKSLVGQYA